MTSVRKSTTEELLADKKELQRLFAQQQQALGLLDDPQATPQRAREMMKALGIRPEGNQFSRHVTTAREE